MSADTPPAGLHPTSVDLSDDESFRNGFPHEFFAYLRNEHPVWWHEPTSVTPDAEGFWVVSRYQDVNEVFLRSDVYSSDKGGVRERGGTGMRDEASAGTWMNQIDDPDHHRLRTLVNRRFSPKAVAELEDEIRALAHTMLTSALGTDADFVTGFARELPSQVICMVLGVPLEDQGELLEILDQGIEEYSESVLTPESMRHIRAYARSLIESKQARPDSGIMSTIVNAQLDDGSRLTDFQLVAFFSLLFPAGAETTRSALAGALFEFARRPDQYRRLVKDPALIPTAVEEIVRWTTPQCTNAARRAWTPNSRGFASGAATR